MTQQLESDDWSTQTRIRFLQSQIRGCLVSGTPPTQGTLQRWQHELAHIYRCTAFGAELLDEMVQQAAAVTTAQDDWRRVARAGRPTLFVVKE